MPKPMLLCYDPRSSPWRAKLPPVCAVQGLRFRPLTGADLDVELFRLAAGETGEVEGEPLPEPLLLLCGLTSGGLDRLLPALRKAGVPPRCLKAILTPHNAGWTLRALYGELTKEREELTGGKG